MKTGTIVLLFVASLVVLFLSNVAYQYDFDSKEKDTEAKCSAIGMQVYPEGERRYCLGEEGRLYVVPGGYKTVNSLWLIIFLIPMMGMLLSVLSVWERFNQWRKQR